MINPGKYDKRIQIVQFEKVENEEGFITSSTKVILSGYAEVKTTKGMTLIKSGTDFEKAYTSFRMRYPRCTITRDMLIKFKDRLYSIEYLNNVNEEDKELELQCKVVEKKYGKV